MLRGLYRISDSKNCDLSYLYLSPERMKKRPPKELSGASFSTSSFGSASLEAALLTPVFLCAMCCLMAIGQLLMVEGEIHYAAAQTLRICAKNETIKAYGTAGSKYNVSPAAVFYSLYNENSLCSSWVQGGKNGITVTVNSSRRNIESLNLLVSYQLRIPLPFADHFPLRKKVKLGQRLYSGYTVHGRDSARKNSVVYIARHGTVYHTRPDCSHICLTISDPGQVMGITLYSSMKPCAKCIPRGTIPRQIYITISRDHYHASLSCSGLKRSIRAVPYSQVRGMRQCSRCAGRK